MIVVIMGVAGAGKTTVGELLAAELGWHFIDADDLHPQENIDKMQMGRPLSERDRIPWLEVCRKAMRALADTGDHGVFAFPGLKRFHRKYVLQDLSDIKLIHLIGTFALISMRLRARKTHFFPAELLRSQFEALEPPSEAINLDVTLSPPELVAFIRGSLGI
jgi:gluconokinase